MREFSIWLNDLSTEPLPGGVAAAAVTAAMGAALVAKATRVTLQRQTMDGTDRSALEDVLDLAGRQQTVLMHLADADVRAYRTVLENRSMPTSFLAQGEIWLEATEVPIRLAEACQALLERLARLFDICWPAVHPDLQIGRWLLEAGVRAGLLAAESNIKSCGDAPETKSFQPRIDALK